MLDILKNGSHHHQNNISNFIFFSWVTPTKNNFDYNTLNGKQLFWNDFDVVYDHPTMARPREVTRGFRLDRLLVVVFKLDALRIEKCQYIQSSCFMCAPCFHVMCKPPFKLSCTNDASKLATRNQKDSWKTFQGYWSCSWLLKNRSEQLPEPSSSPRTWESDQNL